MTIPGREARSPMTRVVPLLLAALVAAACGKATAPVAPQYRVPVAINDLRGVVENGTVTLTWTNPQRRVDLSRLHDVVEARVYRTEDDGTASAKPALLVVGKIAGYQELAVIRMASPEPAVVRGPQVRYVDREGLRYGRRYTYVVIAEDSGGRVGAPSERASVTLVAPPEAPAAPRAEAADGEVRVQWQPPARLLDGSVPGPLAYELARSTTPDGLPTAVFPLPVGQTQFVDRAVENDHTYFYAVRAIRQDAGTVLRSEYSARTAATPERTTPPAAPTHLVAVRAGTSVRLSWSASADPNAAGYIVYRAGVKDDFTRLGTTRVPTTTFIDRDLRRGTYRYAVTAHDSAARVNESRPSNVVTVVIR